MTAAAHSLRRRALAVGVTVAAKCGARPPVIGLLAGFRGAHASERAWSFLAVLSGAAAMARAVKDARIRREILAAAGVAAKAI